MRLLAPAAGAASLQPLSPFGVPPDTGWDGLAAPRLPVGAGTGPAGQSGAATCGCVRGGGMVAAWTEGDSACCNWVARECPRAVTQAETCLCGSRQPPAPSAFWLIGQRQLYRLLSLGLTLFLYLLASCSARFLVTPFLLPISDLPKLVPILFSLKLQFFFSLLIAEAFCTLLRFPSPPAFVSSCLCWEMFVQWQVSPSAAFHCFILSPRVLRPDPGQQAQPAQQAASLRHGAALTMLFSSRPNTYALIKTQ